MLQWNLFRSLKICYLLHVLVLWNKKSKKYIFIKYVRKDTYNENKEKKTHTINTYVCNALLSTYTVCLCV